MEHYDVIVVGSGPGGASLAHRLAPSLAASGKRLLMLERGDYLPRSQKNWDSHTVFVEGAYQAPETWHGADGSTCTGRASGTGDLAAADPGRSPPGAAAEADLSGLTIVGGWAVAAHPPDREMVG